MITPKRVVAPFCRLGFPDGSVGPRPPGLRDGRRDLRPERHAHVLQLPARLPARAGHPGGRRRALRGARVRSGCRSAACPRAGCSVRRQASARTGRATSRVGSRACVDAPAKCRVTLSGASLRVTRTLERAGTVHLVLRTHDLEKERERRRDPRPPAARDARRLAAGARRRHSTSSISTLGLTALARLAGAGEVTAILTVLAIDAAGERTVAARRLTLA